METTTLQRLKAAGWKCGRKIDISAFKKRYREIGLEMPANVEAFLEEFGLLHIENCGITKRLHRIYEKT